MSDMIKKDHGPFPEEPTREELKNKVRDLKARLNVKELENVELREVIEKITPYVGSYEYPDHIEATIANMTKDEENPQEDLREFISRMRDKYGHKFDEYFASMEKTDDQ